MSDIDRSVRPKVFPTESSAQPRAAMSYTEAELAQVRAELAQVRRELHDERVRRDEWEKMYNRAVAGAEAALVNEETAALLERLAEWARIVGEVFGVPEYQSAIDDAGQSRELTTRIREALDDSQT